MGVKANCPLTLLFCLIPFYPCGGMAEETPNKTKDSLALLVQEHFGIAKEYRGASGDEEVLAGGV